MSWRPHIDSLSNKLAKCTGVLNTLYFSMVQSRMMYCLLTWGFYYYRLEKLQKRFVRIVFSSKYNAHSEPLFKALDILKIGHLFSQSCLKFVYEFKKRELPKYFLSFQCVSRSSVHDQDTRGASRIDTLYTRTNMAAKCIRSHIPVLLNDTPAIIINKIDTHSIQGFSFFVKRYYLSQYTTQCKLRGCLYVITDSFLSHFQLYHLFQYIFQKQTIFPYIVLLPPTLINIHNFHLHNTCIAIPIINTNIRLILFWWTRYINDNGPQFSR